MITAFRLEAAEATREEAEKLLSDMAVEIQNRLRIAYNQTKGRWVETDFHVKLDDLGLLYEGRLNMKYDLVRR